MELSNVDSEALKYLQGTESTGGTTEEVSPSPEGQGTEASPSPEPKLAQISDDELIELEVGGQKIRKPWKQARSEMMLHADYTRKRQEESKVVKEAEELAAAIRKRDEAYQALIADPQNIIALYEAVTGQKLSRAEAAAVAEKVGDDFVTADEVQRVLEQQKAEAEKIVETRIQELQDAQFINEVDRTTTSTIDAILEENKQILGFYDKEEASFLLKRMAREAKPSSVEELKEAIVEAGKKLNERVETRLKEMQKASAVTQTKLTKQGIEPSGGTAVTAPKKNYGEGKSVNWNDIDKDAEAFLEAALSR